MTQKVTILIVDDHELIRQGIRAILKSERTFQVAGEASTGMEAIQQAEKLKPRVILMDLTMPGLDGIEAVRRIHAADPRIHILALSMHNSAVMIRNVLRAGASGFVLKSDIAKALTIAIKAVSRGDRHFSLRTTEALENQSLSETITESETPPSCLTKREVQVIQLLSAGLSSKQIGDSLHITCRTVETHRANVMRKLNLHSVTQLLHYAFSNRLVEAET